MLKKIAIAVAVLVVGLLAFAATRPNEYRVERSLEMNAPPSVIFAQLDDFRAWQAWSPWEKIDPAMNKTYEGPERQVGSSYAWKGNSEVGEGRMTITQRDPDKTIAFMLEFIEPFAAQAASGFGLASAPNGATKVTWVMQGQNNYVSKVFGIFMDMDSMIGADYEKGLAALKPIVEAEARKQAAAAAAAKAQAEADAAKAAADAAAAAAATAAAEPAPPAPAK